MGTKIWKVHVSCWVPKLSGHLTRRSMDLEGWTWKFSHGSLASAHSGKARGSGSQFPMEYMRACHGSCYFSSACCDRHVSISMCLGSRRDSIRLRRATEPLEGVDSYGLSQSSMEHRHGRI